MPDITIHTSADLHRRLVLLESERALAALEGLSTDPAYMTDLLGEIAGVRAAYVGMAVTEIASLEGALFGRNQG